MQEGVAKLDELLGRFKGVEVPRPVTETAIIPNKGKAKLNEENQVLLAQNVRMSRYVRIATGVCALLALVVGCLLVRESGLEAKMFRKAFEVLHYREARTLQANAVVLAEYSQGLGKIRDEVIALPGISDDERQVRLKAMNNTITQADNLRDGFLKLVKENEKERGQGISFEYRDPFLKRPIKFDEEMGGEISLDKLRDEVKLAAKMDDAMTELRTAMLNPIPIADQIRAEAKRQNAPVVSLDNDQSSPAAQPLKLPGITPSGEQAPLPPQQ